MFCVGRLSRASCVGTASWAAPAPCISPTRPAARPALSTRSGRGRLLTACMRRPVSERIRQACRTARRRELLMRTGGELERGAAPPAPCRDTATQPIRTAPKAGTAPAAATAWLCCTHGCAAGIAGRGWGATDGGTICHPCRARRGLESVAVVHPWGGSCDF